MSFKKIVKKLYFVTNTENTIFIENYVTLYILNRSLFIYILTKKLNLFKN